MKLSDQYIAGFFDGEGHLGIQVNSKNRSHVLVASFSQSDRDVLERIQSVFGGVITPRNRIHGGFQLWFRAKETEAMLKRLLPFLIVKRDEAEVSMRFLDHKRQNRIEIGYDVETKGEIKAEREWFRQKLSSLKRERVAESHAFGIVASTRKR